MKKLLLILSVVLFAMFWSVFAEDEYLLFYWDGNSESKKIDTYLENWNYYDEYKIEKNDIYFNEDSWGNFVHHMQLYSVQSKYWKVPFMVIKWEEEVRFFVWYTQIKSYFDQNGQYTFLKFAHRKWDYIKTEALWWKEKKACQKVADQIYSIFKKKSNWNTTKQVKMYEAAFKLLDSIMIKKKKIKVKLMIQYIKFQMVRKYLQMLK